METSQDCRQNCSVANILRTTENCRRLSPTQFTLPTPTRQDKTVLSCQCQQCELGITRHNQNCGLDVAWSSDGCDGRLAITPSWFLLLTVPLCITTGQIVHTHKYACASRQYNFVLARGQWYSVVERVTVSVVFH